MSRARWMVFACVALAACGEKEAPNPDVDSAPIVAVQGPAARDTAPRDTPWVVTPRGIGPVKVGMTPREALGLTMDIAGAEVAGATCAYVKSGRVPAGVGVMASGGQVARIDVDSGTVATAEGAKIGDPEARIHQLYAGRVKEQPHKYTNGHYLVVTPADTAYRLVFETDGRVVTAYRAGREPEVEWVEKCG